MADCIRGIWGDTGGKTEGDMGHYTIIGGGSIGRRHYENLVHLGADARLIGWRGLSEADLGAALDGAIGAVIATATDIRKLPIRAAVERGVALYIEKPLAYRAADLTALMEVAAPVAERSVAGFMMRYHPAVRALYDDPVEAFRFSFEIGHDVRQWRQNWRFADSYAARSEGGGVLLDLCHEIDLASFLVPGVEVVSVDAVGHADFPGVDFAARVSMARDGAHGAVAMDYLSPRFIRRASLIGRETGIDLDLLNGRQVRWRGDKETSRDWDFERNEMFLGIMGDFMALAEGRAPSDTPLLPRLDRVAQSCGLIANAWEARKFTGEIVGGFD